MGYNCVLKNVEEQRFLFVNGAKVFVDSSSIEGLVEGIIEMRENCLLRSDESVYVGRQRDLEILPRGCDFLVSDELAEFNKVYDSRMDEYMLTEGSCEC
jgi:hypothetical protein